MGPPRSPKPLALTVNLTPDDRVRRHPYYHQFLLTFFAPLLGETDLEIAREALSVAPTSSKVKVGATDSESQAKQN
jgi:hypothetical protein